MGEYLETQVFLSSLLLFVRIRFPVVSESLLFDLSSAAPRELAL